MKLLFDSCISIKVSERLPREGFDASSVLGWPRDPGDREIMRKAYAEQRSIVTLDKDFGELAVLHDEPHYGIVRLVDLSTRQQEEAVREVIETC